MELTYEQANLRLDKLKEDAVYDCSLAARLRIIQGYCELAIAADRESRPETWVILAFIVTLAQVLNEGRPTP